ncbi:peroxidase [Sedimentitalea sp. CY04]|uniref:Peroxidase n=1 Tax=Parasedimentitalea denitrificans TaxID=2211118 RepID=A0ABX0W7X5_9RHOB|nr:peroxidase-related enzyme [Sedimentitalea sp. CY04]NIZ61018.1 peroxidase [Sedimentitalea sp. CY04]
MKNLFPSLPENATLSSIFSTFPSKLAPLLDYMNQVMREESELTIAQREMIAAYVSGLNACTYCHGSHMVHARAFGIEVAAIEALMDDVETAPVAPELKPVLNYVAKLTQSPTRMTEADAAAVYEAGWSEGALFDAIQVCGLFNMMNRILEGTGITEYNLDPKSAGEDQLQVLRSKECYRAFGRANGVSQT